MMLIVGFTDKILSTNLKNFKLLCVHVFPVVPGRSTDKALGMGRRRNHTGDN